jgi:hypothetical protein
MYIYAWSFFHVKGMITIDYAVARARFATSFRRFTYEHFASEANAHPMMHWKLIDQYQMTET